MSQAMNPGLEPTPSVTVDLDFERPLAQLERQISHLESSLAQARRSDDESSGREDDFAMEIRKLRESHTTMLRKIYENLSGANTVKVARHPARPQTVDYLRHIVKDFCELHGDRTFGDDPAIICGFGRIGSHKCMLIGHQKGRDTRERIHCNFGMAHPEGYRKALRAMKLAEKYRLPVVCLIDTPGAFPGIGAEERGQAQAIAVNIMEMARLRTPILAVIIGEGGSGGALGIGVADRTAMLQYAWYSVISPEACSSILWKTAEQTEKAAEALKLTARDNLKLGTIDGILEEPLGGAHRNPLVIYDRVEKWATQHLREIKRFKIENLIRRRQERLGKLGRYADV
ncbi:MAG: acetyl-CoA carboxylase carboxyltransferase subunit alpha [Phycisphaeraceae bacterium]|nr:acetyl-CoA carboxylase carboxyltransferase subunit alpha [Phycisphaeraceae bacterium]